MMKTFFLSILSIFILLSSTALACEPCEKELNFEETVRNSDLIIIGKKIQEGPRSDVRLDYPGGPIWIRIKVLKVLKGEVNQDTFKIDSWHAMCPYGIVIEDGSYVIFLQKKHFPNENYPYEPVMGGCAVKTYQLIDGMVYFKYTIYLDEEVNKITLDDFIRKLELISKD